MKIWVDGFLQVSVKIPEHCSRGWFTTVEAGCTRGWFTTVEVFRCHKHLQLCEPFNMEQTLIVVWTLQMHLVPVERHEAIFHASSDLSFFFCMWATCCYDIYDICTIISPSLLWVHLHTSQKWRISSCKRSEVRITRKNTKDLLGWWNPQRIYPRR